MSAVGAAALLRPGVLDGVDVAVAGVAGAAPFADAAAGACAGAGAAVRQIAVDPFGDEPAAAPADVLVWDGAGAFATRPGVEAVRAALDGAWLAVRAGARRDEARERGGKVVFLAPPSGDEHAAAARAGLENLARTLSIEWARFGVRTVTILPGQPAEAASLVAYLATPAGDYFSGTALTLR